MTTAFANDTTSEITSATQVAALERFADRPFATIIAREAAAHGVPLNLAHAVINIESSYRSSVTGAAGEVGLMQIKPATARGMGYRGSTKALYDPATNIKWGMRYLAGAVQRGGGTTCGTILKYNAGHYAKRMNPISQRYCSKVKRELAQA
ncbi:MULTISPECIES: lytic transglycosylase domain-containing protein [Aurantimonas]|uniref:lytic transglycosylase domain-containing protein n=1 Tax=Aurantimonas TaxID=182269 RepID=UPI0035161B0D